MPHPFDTGYANPPFRALCESYPDGTVYPPDHFRVEWGPIFHRGRLDGSARVLVIGQDPAQHEAVARRILVGEAGQRVQGLLGKLGIETSYVMVNTFLYSVYSKSAGRYADDPGIVGYRDRWLDALLPGKVEVVVALGALADGAWQKWKATPRGAAFTPGAYERITHPTQPESSSKADAAKRDAAVTAMLANWNAALATLAPALRHPDRARPLVPYGAAFAPGDLAGIPEVDLPPGMPAWMRGVQPWARRTGTPKRANLTITVPKASLP
ncbi:MAG: uracil-DNA glycosylase [Polyangiaceae bacterium]|nr:uracil-DNA glycosylase [Polyangiaceae bacterium]